jgi:transcriptional regulator with XRE-family HTH domain
MASFVHLGELIAHYRVKAGMDVSTAAAIAGVKDRTWLDFEALGTRVSPDRIGRLATELDVPHERLHALIDPWEVLVTAWGPELGSLLRETRAANSKQHLAQVAGVSASTLDRWERALTRPRNQQQLVALFGALRIDPVTALEYALWPPRTMMIERPPLGVALLARRSELGLTCRAAAAMLGSTQGGFHAWERGRNNPTARFVPAIASFLDVPQSQVEQMLTPRHVDTYGLDPVSKSRVKRRLASFTKLSDVAAKTGLTPSRVARYELGKSTPPVTDFAKYAAAVGVSPVEAAFNQLGVSVHEASIGQLLKATRMSRAERLKEAAAALGATHTQLGQWESDLCLPKTVSRRARLVTAVVAHYGLRESDVLGAWDRTTVNVDPFGVWLKAAVAGRGLTVTEASYQVGTSKSLMGAWVNGQCRPGTRFAPAIAKVLGVRVADVESQLAVPRLAA